MDEKIILVVLGAALLLIIFIAIIRLRNDIKYTNFILKQISEKIGIPEPSEDSKIKAFIQEGKRIEAIKRYREITGAGLKEANDYINRLV
ncbi:ribosomal L7/L12-like protein [Anaerobacterium chartisolvens]|uniref:Ribosomal L7/L12-like protein n=1 Tax=Anaerobacterium chartisolvens TaxID=1297424 RepID=A0A369B9D6_9FIRM|nr:50S ribosomal protein L7/L12 [Anaerobacterium chartisolvens]RCX17935.1 ribosomal L7/L12-like protein [Anaerobacterium chartisolvens]